MSSESALASATRSPLASREAPYRPRSPPRAQDTTPEDFERCWRANCFGGFLGARFACLAVGKFGLRALAQSLARELQPQGIHVAHVVVDGQIDTPRARTMFAGRDPATMISPDAIAEANWQLHLQEPTCWTQEMDVRPATEKF